MKKIGRYGAVLLITLVGLLLGTGAGEAQFAGGGPKPGDVYKEFYFTHNSTNWRVTDPGVDLVKYPEAAAFLPNPTLYINVDDLAGATKAEVVIDFWCGHEGTTGRAFRFNGNSWIYLPDLPALSDPDNKYMHQTNHLVSVPLSHLKVGSNAIEGTSGPNGWDWGQWGWFGIVLRVYYSPSKPHATGHISSHTSGSLFTDNPTLSAAITQGTANRVDFLAYYDGYDTDGDGVYKDWHRNYHRTSWTETIGIKGHVGTDTTAPFSVTWDTSWIPDQDPGQVKFIARIRDTNGYWYVTPEVSNLSFQRSSASVKLYKPTTSTVPQLYWVRVGQVKSHKVNIPTLSGATAALMHTATWNGNETGASFYNNVNSWTAPKYGKDHFYSYDLISVPTSALRTGDNTITFSSSTVHHGIEVMWPAPAIAVRYGTAPPPPTPTAPTITQQPSNQTVQVGQTATFSVSATGTATLRYQWRKNGASISGATSASYTTPATTTADNGAVFSCVVSNDYGSVTSNNATLTVQQSSTGTAPVITQQPSSRTVQVGQTATFTVTATGTTPLNYQWRKNGAPISGATSGSYTTPPATTADNGALFSCVVSNSYGSVTSSSATLVVVTSTPSESNGVSNPGFESGTSGWNYYTNGQGSFTASSPGYEGSMAASVAITSTGTNNQLYQYGIALEPNTDYRLSFVAYSSSGRDLKVSLLKHGSPYTDYGISMETVDLGSGWSSHVISFRTRNFAAPVDDARLMFWFADTAAAGDQFWIDSVVLIKGSATTTTNIVGNPGFEAGTSGWTFYTSGSGTFAASSPGDNSASAGKVSIISKGTNTQLYQQGLALEPNTQYQLKFSAYCPTGRDVKVSLLKHVSPYTNYGVSMQSFDLSTGWGAYSLTFNTPNFGAPVNDGRLMFWFADTGLAGDAFFIDNVELSKK